MQVAQANSNRGGEVRMRRSAVLALVAALVVLVGGLTRGAPARAACTFWNLTSDFGGSNPQPDSCGDPSVWYYLTATNPSSPLNHYVTSFGLGTPLSGLDVWENAATPNLAPYIGKNNTGVSQVVTDPTGGSG